MVEGIVAALPNIFHLALHITDFIAPSARCPDCVCSVPSAANFEATEALTSALRFAQQQCHNSPAKASETSSVPGFSWSFLFWLGFVFGICFSVLVIFVIRLCLRAIGGLHPQQNPAPAVAQPQLLAQRTLTEGEPANPATLRQLGLLR